MMTKLNNKQDKLQQKGGKQNNTKRSVTTRTT